jgi:uncharacterized protein involved in type VI secretion and phage assembly
MNLVDVLTKSKVEEELVSRVFGVVVGIVTNIDDPDGLGRVKVKFPWLKEDVESHWSRIMSLMAGNESGCVFRPEVEDEVLVLFEHGDTRCPYVIGALWNGQDAMPSERGSDSDNNIRLIKSRSGHIIKLDDTAGSEKIEIIDKKEKNTIVIDTSSNKILISADTDIELKASNGKILLDATEIEIKSSGSATVEASGDMTIKGSTVNIN